MKSATRTRYPGGGPTKQMSKEQLYSAIKKKKECDAKALTIVEGLIESNVSESWLLESVQDILLVLGVNRNYQLEHVNRCHMEDVIEERAILKRCGYALCDNPLLVTINQQYHISTRSNKVYDVSRRKNFCSNFCYGAANYLMEQMLTSPLWLRDTEKKPDFLILSRATSTRTSIPGDEVQFTDIESSSRSDLESDNNNRQAESKTVDEDATANDIQNKLDATSEVSKPDNVHEKLYSEVIHDEPISIHQKLESQVLAKETICPISPQAETLGSSEDKSNKNLPDPKENDTQSRNDLTTEVKERKIRRKKVRRSKTPETIDASAIVMRIERCLEEWMTLESLNVILGDSSAKEQVAQEIETIKHEKKYLDLCQKIDQLQVDEDINDVDELEARRKPLPNYEVLNEEGKKLEVKVRAFFDGSTAIDVPIKQADNSEEEAVLPSILPSNDGREPKLMRRRILLNKLDKVLPELVRTLAGGPFVIDGCIGSNGCGETVKVLVKTFTLSANNIIFKPIEWNLLGLVFIKLLSITESRIRFLLNTERASKFITMILMSYNVDPSYLNTLLPLMIDMKNRRQSS